MKPVVVVTGASKGLGLAVVKLLLQELDSRVVVLSRSPVPLQSEHLASFECDVTDESAVRNILKAQPQIDALILNAATLGPLCRIGDDTPLSAWKSHFDVNFFSLITLIKASLPALRKSEHGGRIVMISSGAAIKGTPGWAPYNASKAAMNSLCRTLAEEEPKVTCVALRPGIVDTDMQALIRVEGHEHMSSSDHRSFVQAKEDGKLLAPELPGRVIAGLALKAPLSLSGQFVNWNDELLVP